MKTVYERALIVGAGDGLSASVARAFAGAGMRVALAARNVLKLAGLAPALNAAAIACDASDRKQVARMFAEAENFFGAAPDIVVYNPSFRVRGPLVEQIGRAHV